MAWSFWRRLLHRPGSSRERPGRTQCLLLRGIQNAISMSSSTHQAHWPCCREDALCLLAGMRCCSCGSRLNSSSSTSFGVPSCCSAGVLSSEISLRSQDRRPSLVTKQATTKMPFSQGQLSIWSLSCVPCPQDSVLVAREPKHEPCGLGPPTRIGIFDAFGILQSNIYVQKDINHYIRP